MARDAAATTALHEMGWSVLRFWETEVTRNLDTVVRLVTDALC